MKRYGGEVVIAPSTKKNDDDKSMLLLATVPRLRPGPSLLVAYMDSMDPKIRFTQQ
jgi:hypothetical protein